MKRKLVLILSFAFFIACYGNEKSSNVLIKGSILNNTAKSISIGDSLIQITKSGTFLLQKILSEPQNFVVKYQDNQFEIFVEPDEQMEMIFDEKDIDNSIVFKGNSPETNEFLFKLSKIDAHLENYFKTSSIEWRNLFSKSEQKFLQDLDLLKSLYQKPLDELMSNKNVNQKFLFKARMRNEFTFDWMILQYPHFHKDFTGKQIVLSKKTKTNLDEINLDNPNLIEVDEYSLLGNALLHSKIKTVFRKNEELKNLDNQWLQASFNVIEQNFQNQKTIDYWLFHYLYKHIDDNGVKNIKSFVDKFNNTCISKKLKTKLNLFYKKELENREGHLIKTYKTINGFELDAHIFIPDSFKEDEKRPAIINFHGGSWSEGKPDWTFGYSNLEFINVCIEYRTYDRYGTLLFEQISDAKSAIRYLRENANKFHIDENKIIASGNSAGGHLALCTAMLDILDEPNENKSISSKPNALILTSAVYDVTKGIWFDNLVDDKQRLKDISPTYNINNDLPPMLIFHGTADTYSSPFRNCETFVEKMKNKDNEVYFYQIENVGHSLWLNGRYWQISGKARMDFYKKLGIL